MVMFIRGHGAQQRKFPKFTNTHGQIFLQSLLIANKDKSLRYQLYYFHQKSLELKPERDEHGKPCLLQPMPSPATPNAPPPSSSGILQLTRLLLPHRWMAQMMT